MSPVPRDVGPVWTGPLEATPDPLAVANAYRYAPTSAYERLDVAALRGAAARCRAASYSLLTAARRLEHRAAILERPTT